MTFPDPSQDNSEEALRKRRMDLLMEQAISNKDILAIATLELVRSVDKMDGKLTIQEQSNSRLKRIVKVVSAVAAMTAITTAFVAYLVVRVNGTVDEVRITAAIAQSEADHNKTFAACISSYETKVNARSVLLTDLAKPRQDALSAVLRTLTESPTKFQADFDRALTAYFAADDAYTDQLSKTPIPPSPEFTCK